MNEQVIICSQVYNLLSGNNFHACFKMNQSIRQGEIHQAVSPPLLLHYPPPYISTCSLVILTATELSAPGATNTGIGRDVSC